jgi:hypothetical protein
VFKCEVLTTMPHLLPGSTATADVGSAPCAVGSTQRSPARVLVTEQSVLFNTAAAIQVPAATSGRRWLGATLTAAIGGILTTLAEPRPHYPPREPKYFEVARMSREMDHL